MLCQNPKKETHFLIALCQKFSPKATLTIHQQLLKVKKPAGINRQPFF